ncbi:hypothetical protein DEAB109302_08980 [Dermacoccus abyssi]
MESELFMWLFISVLVGMFDDELPEPRPSLLQAATPNTAQADRVMAARRFLMVPSLANGVHEAFGALTRMDGRRGVVYLTPTETVCHPEEPSGVTSASCDVCTLPSAYRQRALIVCCPLGASQDSHHCRQ